MNSYLRCPSCKGECLDGNIKHEDYMMITECCDEICERVWLCTECGINEQHGGVDQCMECLCDSVIADPREIEQCNTKLQGEIAKALAERLRPWLRQVQAA
jgi:hypothetical protein